MNHARTDAGHVCPHQHLHLPARAKRKRYILAADVAKLLEVDPVSVRNWTLYGSPFGTRVVFLQVLQAGGVAKYRRKWVREFTEACLEARRESFGNGSLSTKGPTPPPPRPSEEAKQAKASYEQAKRALES